MTDLDTMRAMLDQAGIRYTEEPNPDDPGTILWVGNVIIAFTPTGHLANIGIFD